jgi:hypothetical protein
MAQPIINSNGGFMYSFIKNKKTEWKINIDDIRNIEEKYNILFPEKLAEFLLECNGAEIYESRVEQNDVSYGIIALTPVKYGDSPVEQIMEWNRLDGILRDDIIPIAYDRGGNNYYVDSKNGEVLLYYSDDIENPRVISTDINSFLSKIKVYME